jgi:hypothetical protein
MGDFTWLNYLGARKDRFGLLSFFLSFFYIYIYIEALMNIVIIK